MSETETRERCGYAVTDAEGIEQPCDRPATGWRWYQDVGHQDCLLPACDWHANYGGDRMHAAEAELSRLRGVVEAVQALADEWERRAGDRAARPKSRIDMHEAVDSIRAALAPVSSSGEAESGEGEARELAGVLRRLDGATFGKPEDSGDRDAPGANCAPGRGVGYAFRDQSGACGAPDVEDWADWEPMNRKYAASFSMTRKGGFWSFGIYPR